MNVCLSCEMCSVLGSICISVVGSDLSFLPSWVLIVLPVMRALPHLSSLHTHQQWTWVGSHQTVF